MMLQITQPSDVSFVRSSARKAEVLRWADRNATPELPKDRGDPALFRQIRSLRGFRSYSRSREATSKDHRDPIHYAARLSRVVVFAYRKLKAI
jgi:hypothetical protein